MLPDCSSARAFILPVRNVKGVMHLKQTIKSLFNRRIVAPPQLDNEPWVLVPLSSRKALLPTLTFLIQDHGTGTGVCSSRSMNGE